LEILERMHGFLLFRFNRSPENPAAMAARVIHFIGEDGEKQVEPLIDSDT
jgi:hypothetical protein